MKQSVIEKNLSSILSNDYVLEVSSGTTALIISLLLSNKDGRSEVIIPSICCPAVLNAVNYCDLNPVFVDMETNYFNMDIKSIENSITKNTLAIIGVHTYGITAPIEEMKKIANKYNVILIEDCCLSIGGRIGDAAIGSFGDLSIFSFGYDKIISETGGALVLQEKEKFLAAKKIIEKNEIFKCHEYDEVVMQNKFDTLEQNISRRSKNAQYYFKELSSTKITKPKFRDGDVYWRYPILFHGNRKKLIQIAKDKNLIVTQHYPSLAKFQYGTNLPISENFDTSIINFFVNESATDKYITNVCRLVNSYE